MSKQFIVLQIEKKEVKTVEGDHTLWRVIILHSSKSILQQLHSQGLPDLISPMCYNYCKGHKKLFKLFMAVGYILFAKMWKF